MAEDADLPDNADDIAAGIDTTDPKSAKSWLALIKRGEKAFEAWHTKCDNLDKWYANLERLATSQREREFQLFWANMQVLAPSVYSRCPVPVVVPAFKDKRPLYRITSELLERVSVTTYRVEDIDFTMRLLRDDMLAVARATVWLRYDTTDGQEVCIEHVTRRDFLHDPARKWTEVGWVAKRSWLTRKEARKRFLPTSGDEYKNASYAVRKDPNDEADNDGTLKAGFWELWSKSKNKVVWIADGCDKLLDEGAPHLELDGFFPCPRPAYGTLQRDSLIPVPDMLFYKDQLEEINELTGRIGALTEKLRLQGFYPAGAGEIGDAIEAAIKSKSNNAILIPISNWAALGGAAAKDAILWLPLDMVTSTIESLIELRKQLIEDVYQITGLSDIMRGDTEPDETLGAQQLKSQYGSIRVHDRQAELVRIARDITRIAGEIAAENFSAKTLLDMSQMQVPSNADIAKQIAPLKKSLAQLAKEIQDAQRDPEIQQMAQQNPDAAKQVIQQAQQHGQELQSQIQALEATVTIEQVVACLRDNRMRPFELDIETDSTIAPDEARQQAQMTQFVEAIGGYLGQAVPMVEQVPQIAPVVSAVLKLAASQFRVGREIEGVIDEFADHMAQIAQQPKGPSPEALKAQADLQAAQSKLQQDQQAHQAEMQMTAVKADAEKTKAALDVRIKELELGNEQQAATSKQTIDELQAKLDAAIAAAENSIELKKIASQEKQAAWANLVKIKVAQATASDDSDETVEPVADALERAVGLSPEQNPNSTGAKIDMLHKAVTDMHASITAPTEIIHDANGRPIGARKVTH